MSTTAVSEPHSPLTIALDKTPYETLCMSEKPPQPGDDGYEEWLEDMLGCDNCGSTNWRKEELRFGPLEGSLVEVCAECGYPYLHIGSEY